MKYIHVRNIEQYHPGYKDRELKWAKVMFSMVQGDPEFELIPNEIDKWRFITLITLELSAKKPLPMDDQFFTRKGWNIKKRPMLSTIQMLHNFVDVVTQDEKLCVLEGRREGREEGREEKRENFESFCNEILKDWNILTEQHPALSSVRSITTERRKHLKNRFSNKDFTENYKSAFQSIPKSDFLMGRIDGKNWRANFDWFIRNDENFSRILEGQYHKCDGKSKELKDLEAAL